MSVRVAINGFGRVGRCAFRVGVRVPRRRSTGSAINDVADVATLAHLLRHDSVYGPFPGTVEVDGSALVVDGVEIPVFARATRASSRGPSPKSTSRSSARADSARAQTPRGISPPAPAR